MRTVTTDRLAVPGGALHYRVSGAGPLLLISQSGEGDADRSIDLVERLVDAYTVVTYDRRGLSRSAPVDDPARLTIGQHADDVHRLLSELTDEPSAMLGCSLGASIGLHLARHHPEQVSVLVAHEPVMPRLLRPRLRRRHEEELGRIQKIYRAQGLGAALHEVARSLGIDPSHPAAEPGLRAQPMTPQRVRNFDFFLIHDLTAIQRDTFEADALAGIPTRIIPAAGRSTPPEVFDRQCAGALEGLTGTRLVEFPGGHNGNTTHPRAYAAVLRKVLSTEK